MNSKELVKATLEFKNTSGRIPRQLWVLPWAEMFQPQQLKHIIDDFKWDIVNPKAIYSIPSIAKGDMHEVGEATDNWGCKFINIHRGVIGEVKEPLVQDDDWEDVGNIHIPEEELSFNVEQVNEACKEISDKFLLGGCCPRPFEQLQFIRGTENLYMDLVDPPKKMLEFIEQMHDFYCRLLTKWAQTDVDALNMMDDWGSQNSLLISPTMWEKIFKPMYKDYIDIAHKHGKYMFMHSDGNTLQIIPHLIEIGLDAFNTQIFCIGVDKLEQFRGKITFWGEIDRQQLIPNGTIEEIRSAVDSVYNNLWKDGGIIAQCEYGPAANPDNVYEIFKHWTTKR